MSQTCDAMNAVTVTQPGLAVLTQVPIPAVEAGQILVKVSALLQPFPLLNLTHWFSVTQTKAVTLNPTGTCPLGPRTPASHDLEPDAVCP